VITIHGDSAKMKIPARIIPENQWTSSSTLMVRKSSKGRRLEGVYVAELNAALYVQPTAATVWSSTSRFRKRPSNKCPVRRPALTGRFFVCRTCSIAWR
jgi:hypothetical protein